MTTQYPDVPIQSVSQEVYEKKYRLMDYHGNPVDSDIQDTYKRVAKALASVEDDSTKWEKEFYWALENGAIPAGRIISNAGAEDYKPSTSTINCTVSGRIDDSMESILDRLKEAGLTLKAGCGIGYHFSSLRPKGALVSGVGAATSGPLSFMDVFDALCATVSSAGGRRGAQMATFLIRHPDVLDYVKAKRQDGRLRQFNMSVLVTEDFLQALQNDQDWEFMFPVRLEEHDLYPDAEYRFMHWYEELDYSENYIYNMEDSEQVLCKVYGRMKATEIWDVIAESTYDYAEPGVIFIDEYNKMNNNWFCETILATNPCVSGDTLVLTDQGNLPIQTLVGRKVNIWNGYEWSRVEPKITGTDQEMLKISFSDGSIIRCTKYHKFVLADDARIEAKNLTIGLKLKKYGFPVVEGATSLDKQVAYTQGFYCGDGSSNISEIWLYGEKIKLRPYLYGTHIWNDKNKDRAQINLPKYFEQNKGKVLDTEYSINTRLDWLAGLIDSDGTRSSKDGGFSIWSSNREFLLEVKRMLNTLGVNGTISLGSMAGVKLMHDGTGGKKEYPVQDCYRISVSPYNTKVLCDLGLETHRVDLSSSPTRDASRFISIIDIEEDGIEDLVYCFNEPINHTAIFNGVMTAQCGEQGLPPWGACLLGSINLTKFVNNPFSEDAHFDSIKFEKVVRIFTRMLDNVVEINGLPLDKQGEEIFRKRRHGMGFTGLGSALTMLRIKYGSKEALEFTKKVSFELAHIGWRTGLELAIEKGPAPIFEEGFVITKRLLRLQPALEEDGYKEDDVVKGITLFVKYSNYMRKLKEEIQDDEFFEELENKGCRFTHHSSIAPTGTISLALANNASNGIEPSFSHMYFRNLTVEGKKTRQQVPVYSYELLLYRHLIDKDASPESGTLPDYFISSDMVLPSQHIDMQAASQEWIDSSISKTINCPTDMKFESFKNIYSYAAEKGLKGCTTFRFNPTSMTGVLTRKEDLDSTLYKFYLEDGTEIELKGSDKVEYEGEIHNVAMLYDSIKEGRYDRGY